MMGKLGKMFLYGDEALVAFAPMVNGYPVSPFLHIKKAGWHEYMRLMCVQSPKQAANLMLDTLDVVLLWCKDNGHSPIWQAFHQVTQCKTSKGVDQNRLLNLILQVKGTKEEKFAIQSIRCLTGEIKLSKQAECLLRMLSCLVEYDQIFDHLITQTLLYQVAQKLEAMD